MSNIKAILIGVSNYNDLRFEKLPLCINDINAMKEALINGLKLDESDILIAGEDGNVYGDKFIEVLKNAKAIVEPNDTLIFYFSGHGETVGTNHRLILTDKEMETQIIIDILNSFKAENKIFFLDSCFSGNYKVDKSATFDINKTVDEFSGKGFAVLSSSNAVQSSWTYPEKSLSLFTSFLVDAIQDKIMIRKGQKTLYDIKKLVFFYMDLWNRRNPSMIQQPIYRANLGGTITFDVELFKSFLPNSYYLEFEGYIIYKVEALHHGFIKRYSIKVILKDSFSLEEIADISKEIVSKAKTFEVFNNRKSEDRFSGKPLNIAWIYFARSTFDINNANYICHTTWVDNNQDKNWWYRVSSDNNMFINDVHFQIHSQYESMRNFIANNIGDKKQLISNIKMILSEMLTLAECVIAHYNEYINELIDELALVNLLAPILANIDKLYIKSTNLDIADESISEWDEACTLLFATIHDFTIFYGKQHMQSRSTENRIANMDITIKRYHNDLEKVRCSETSIVT